jgi:RNA polymerase sigma-70 factor (ECF subfamily)
MLSSPSAQQSSASDAERFARLCARALPASVRELAAPGALDARLREAWQAGRAAWPAIALSPSQLAEHLAARVATVDELDAVLEPETARELWLTCACCLGDASAIRQLEARYFPIVAGALVRMRLPPHSVDDILQQLRAHLFAPRAEAEMGIASFRGRGALVSWIKVSAVRMACQLLDAVKKQSSDGDEALARISVGGADVEKQYARSWSHDAFKRAFASALARLDDRDKALLRLHYIDGVSLERLAALYRTHRATAARWLGSARQRLLDGTRAALADEHRIPLAECDSIIRSARSQLELTLHSLFATAAS